MVKNFEDIFIRFGATHERDKRTDGQTPGDSNSRAMHSIARQKYMTLLLVLVMRASCVIYSIATHSQ